MKSIARLLLLTPFIFACSNKTSYTGEKILTIEHDESGQFVEVKAQHMFENAYQGKIDSIYYIGDDNCVACTELKPKIGVWMAQHQARVYYIKYASIDDENFTYLSNSTVGYYEWTEKSTVPAVYFFANGDVVFKGDDSNTMNYLNRYVGVKII